MTSTDVKVRLLFHKTTLFHVNYCIFTDDKLIFP